MADAWAIALATRANYQPYHAWAIAFGAPPPEAPPKPLPLPRLRASIGAPYGYQAKKHAQLSAPFSARTRCDRSAQLPWRRPEGHQAGMQLAWFQMPSVLAGCKTAWADSTAHTTMSQLAWRQYRAVLQSLVGPWATSRKPLLHDVSTIWGLGDKITATTALLWQDTPFSFSLQRGLPWSAHPPERLRLFTARWGRRQAVTTCRFVYNPFDPWAIRLATLNGYTPDDARAIVLATRRDLVQEICTTDPGGRPLNPPPLVIIPKARAQAPIFLVYWIMNSVNLYRYSDGLPLEAFSVSLSVASQEFAWTTSLKLADRDSLNRVIPRGLEPREVMIDINGYQWRVFIEGYSLDASFPAYGYAATGKSLQAYLATPYARATARLQTDPRLAQQIAFDELQYTDFTLDWQLPDWLIPGNTFSYQELTPVLAIGRLAEAAGGVVLPVAAAKTVVVAPRYPVTPWDFWATAPDMRITHDLITSMSESRKPAPGINAVWVSGQQAGVLVKVKRRGTAGDRYPDTPLITDPLITDVNSVARSRGISIISEHQPLSNVQLELPLMPAGEPPGLLLPNTFLEVATNYETWRGLVRATRISAQWGSNGLEVTQSIEVERHF